MNSTSITPLFIFSLPRSGSTLLQRVLASHNTIATTSEPWVLLPLLYTRKDKGAFAEYGHRASTEAIGDFIKELPGDKKEYNDAIRELVLRLYSSAANNKPGSQYFLDKTPRYHLIAEQIIELFPDAKFIFLWRNPLAITASIIDTFGRGKWQLYDYKVDLFDGFTNLIECQQKYSDRILSIRFEDLVSSPSEQCNRIEDYLDLPQNTLDVSSFNKVTLKGNMGDPTGQKQYNKISTQPLSKWNKTLANPLRRNWAKRYLNWIGHKHLSRLGYDYEQLEKELHDLPFTLEHLSSDSIRALFGIAQCLLEIRTIKNKIAELPNWINIHSHM